MKSKGVQGSRAVGGGGSGWIGQLNIFIPPPAAPPVRTVYQHYEPRQYDPAKLAAQEAVIFEEARGATLKPIPPPPD